MAASQICFLSALILSYALLYEIFPPSYNRASFTIGVIAVTILFVWLGVKARPQAVPLYYGIIKPHRALLFSTSDPLEAMGGLEVGTSGSLFIWMGPPGQPMINLWGQDITVEHIDGAVKVSTTLRSRTDHLLVELIRNEWKVSPPPATWDRNYSDDALEVKGPDGNIVLQIKALPDHIQLQGEWWNEDGTVGMRLVGNKGAPGIMLQLIPTDLRSDLTIKPMFKYPGDQHLGELVDSVVMTHEHDEVDDTELKIEVALYYLSLSWLVLMLPVIVAGIFAKRLAARRFIAR
jgi:hypothetical protein